MLQWLLAIVAALVVGGGVTWIAGGPLRRRDETAAGIAALSAMSWREFIRVVLEALSRRGYHRLVDHASDTGDSDHTLVRNGDHWLLSAKHGSAFVIGRASVNALAEAMRVAGASGGLLITQGRIEDDARRSVHGQPIELLDGATLWPELRPLLPPAAVQPILDAAANRARERRLAGWLLALIAGIAVFALVPVRNPVPAAAPSASAPVAGSPQAPVAPAALETGAGVAPDITSLETQRRELARSVATLPAVSRAQWTSSSTLEVSMIETDGDLFAEICPLVERYPALASSRIQLTPPTGSDRAVRFRQCRSY